MLKDYRKVSRNNSMTREQRQNQHYRMYKAKTSWVFAGLFALAIFGANTASVKADDGDQTGTAPKTAEVNSSSVTNSSEVVLGQSTASEASDSSSADSSSSAVTSEVDSSAATDATSADTASSASADSSTAQTVTRVAAAMRLQSESSSVTVGTTTKTYNNDATTPANYLVTLSENLEAPSGWYVSDTANTYYVSSTSGDLDLSSIGQEAGTYDLTLSAQGITKLQTTNPTATITAQTVVAGKLIISQAPTASGSVVISSGSKAYDNDSSTDPTSYTVSISSVSGLVAPSDWTDNGDGTYTVTVASGDLNVGISSQDVGRYLITLSDQGLAKLQTMNPNYSITNATVTTGVYQIKSNASLITGSTNLNQNTNVSTLKTLTATLNNASSYTIPSDWTINYNNKAQGSIVYNVPISYFDTSAVNSSVLGSYSVTLSASGLAAFNALNTTNQLTAVNVDAGAVNVVVKPTSTTTWNVANYWGSIKGNGVPKTIDGVSYTTYALAQGSTLTLDLKFTNSNNTGVVNNLTSIYIVPSGFVVSDVDENGNTIISTDPVATLTKQINDTYTAAGIVYSGLKVTQIEDYDGRQTFVVTFGSVTLAKSTTLSTYTTIMVDPNSTVTSGWVGDYTGSRDSTVLYATDDPKYTNGAYKLVLSGYSTVTQVSTALGIQSAAALNPSYTGFIQYFTITKATVTDTYNFVSPTGAKIQTSKTTTGNPGDEYNMLNIVPPTISTGGKTYVLDSISSASGTILTSNNTTFTKALGTLTAGSTNVTGTTYTAKYKLVVDTTTATNQVVISDQEMVYNGKTPASYTITIPSIYKVPSTWIANTDGTYTITAASGDLDLDDVLPDVGTYSIQLSAQGLSKLAGANTGYLFDSNIDVAGTLTITDVEKKIIVTVKDTNGTTLQPDGLIDFLLNDGVDVTGVDAQPTGYTTGQLQSITFNYDTTSTEYNQYGIDNVLVQYDKATGILTQITNYTDTSKLPSVITATKDQLEAAGTTVGAYLALAANTFGIGFGTTPTVAANDKSKIMGYSSIDVVYYRAAKVDVNYVDDDQDGALVGSTIEISGFEGDTGVYLAATPTGYKLVNETDGTTGVSYTLDPDDPQTITIYLSHIITDTTTTTSRMINYVVDDPNYTGKIPNSVTQNVTWHVTTDEATGVVTSTAQEAYYSVDSPEVKGYTPDVPTVERDYPDPQTGLPTNAEDITVTYTADDQAVRVIYVDDDADGARVGEALALTRKTNETINWNSDNKPAGYDLADGQAAAGTYKLTVDKNQVVTIHLVHHITDTTTTTSRTINYVVDDPNYTGLTPESVTQNVTWKVTTDEVTGAVTSTAQEAYYAVDSPEVKGYTADVPTIERDYPNPQTGLPTNAEDLTVTYTADDQAVRVIYVDDDADGDRVGEAIALSGKTNETINWNSDNKPAGYDLADGQAADGTYKLTVDKNQVVTIHLVHHITDTTTTTSRTINYVVDDPNYTGLTPESVTQNVTWHVTKDEVTGAVTSTAQEAYYAVDSPEIKGYEPDFTTIAAKYPIPQTGLPANEKDVTVTYTAGDQSVKIQYVDDDNNGSVVGTPTNIAGKTNGTVNWDTTDMPSGYELADGQAGSGTYKLTASDNQVVSIHLTHKITDTTATTTRTINYVVDDPNYTGKTPNSVTQNVTWHVTTDEVTGAVTSTAQEAYYGVDSPEIKGYTPDFTTVAADYPDPQTGLPSNAKDFTVTYTADPQKVTVEYVDDDNNGIVVGTSTDLNGKTSETVHWTADNIPAGYVLADGQTSSGEYVLNADDNQVVKIHLIHQIEDTTTTTTQTINYVVDDPNYTGATPDSVTQTIVWNVTTDKVTGAVTSTAQEAYYEVGSPTVAGYTPDITTVERWYDEPKAGLPTNANNITVTYTADDQSVKVQYVDDDNGQTVVGTATVIDGKTSETVSWNSDSKPAGYDLATDQPASGTYKLTAEKNQLITIHLVHHITNATKTTTRTINYVVDDPNYTGKTPETVTQTVTWKVTTDQVTGRSVATAQEKYYEVKTPAIAGYTPDLAKVDEALRGALETDQVTDEPDVTVTYKADDQSVIIEYVDDDNGGAIVGAPKQVDGKTSQSIDWDTTDLPSGYNLAENQAASGTYKLTADKNQAVKIHLTHHLEDSELTTTRTINYVVDDANYQGKTPDTVVQKVVWKVTTDLATGQSVATAQKAYYEVATPTIAGYTPDTNSVDAYFGGAIDASNVANEQDVTVTYTADDQSVSVQYVDDDNGGALVGTAKTVNGKTSATYNWDTTDKPAGYDLADGQIASGTYTFTAEPNQTITIHLIHGINNHTISTTRTINYVVDDPNYTGKVPAQVVQIVEWKVTTDTATGHSVATAQTAYYEVKTPTIAGYTPNLTSVEHLFGGALNTSDVANEDDVTVTYTADDQAVKVVYIDDEDGVEVGPSVTLNGKTSETVDWNSDTKPAGYDLATGQPASGQYKLTGDANQTVQIHLVHHLDDSALVTTRTITYVVDDTNYKGATPNTVVQVVNWKVTSDQVTGRSVATAQQAYYKVTSPEIAGYTVDTASVDHLFKGAIETQDVANEQNVVVTYRANAQSVDVVYVDDDNGGAVVGYKTTLNGKTSETVAWDTTNKPAGYDLASGQPEHGNYTLTAKDGQTVTIHLVHHLEDSTTTTTRTINYVVDDSNYTGQVPDSVVQVVNWKVTTDSVTGRSVAPAQNAYYEVETPEIAGYTADITSVAHHYDGATELADVKNAADVTVTYTANDQWVRVLYVDDDAAGARVGEALVLTGKTSETINWNSDNKQAGYDLAVGQAASGTYKLTAADDQVVTIHLTHHLDDSTITTTRTIEYVVDDPNYTGSVPNTIVQKVLWKVTTDQVTGTSVATAQDAYYGVDSPEIAGYTVDTPQVSPKYDGAIPTKDVANADDVIVTYTANAQSVKVQYVDDDNDGAIVGDTTVINGKTSQTVNWNSDNKPAGYDLADGQPAAGEYVLTADDDQVVTIHLIHHIDDNTIATTRTIKYVVDDPNYTGEVPATITQTIGWIVTTDYATDQHVATAQEKYLPVDSPEIPGYVADIKQVGELYPGAMDLADVTDPDDVIVTYTPIAQQVVLEYVDDNDGGKMVGTPTTINGVTNQTVDWNTDDIPVGYDLAAGQADSGTYKLTADSGQVIQVHLVHHITTGEVTTSRTIHYEGAGDLTPADIVQTVTYDTQTDEVTQITTYTPRGNFEAVESPEFDNYIHIGDAPSVETSVTTTMPVDLDDVVITYIEGHTEGDPVPPDGDGDTDTGEPEGNPDGSDPDGPDEPGTDPDGPDEPGTDPDGPDEPGTNPDGPDEPGTDPDGPDEPGTDPDGPDEPGTDPSDPDDPYTGPDDPSVDPGDPDEPGTDPSDPDGPDEPGTDPSDPDEPGTNPSDPDEPTTNPESSSTPVEEGNTVVTPTNVATTPQKGNQQSVDHQPATGNQKLPQTGEDTNQEMASVGLGLIGLLGMFGIGARKRKRQ